MYTSLKAANIDRYVVNSFNEAGESDDATVVGKTLNPPITVTIDKIGVFDNGESSLRDRDGGEVYVHVVVSNRETTIEQRIPSQEESYLYLEDDELNDIGMTVFSTDSVDDSLAIGIVGFESDGGGLLEVFNFNLGGLVGQFLGEEDDCLGSYENTWDSNDNWGVGSYSDVTCYEEYGTPGLRIWFTIENPMEQTPVSEPDISGTPLIEHGMTLSILDEETYHANYGNDSSHYPYSEFGIHYSKLIK
jgi:hypothetical protein